MNVTLRLLLNLSFDPKLRQEMVKLGFLPIFSSMLSKSRPVHVKGSYPSTPTRMIARGKVGWEPVRVLV